VITLALEDVARSPETPIHARVINKHYQLVEFILCLDFGEFPVKV